MFPLYTVATIAKRIDINRIGTKWVEADCEQPIAKWLMKEKDIDKLVDYSEDKKEFSFASPYRFSIRLAYQTPVKVDFEGEEKEAIPGTFEDCLIYTNYDLFKKIKVTDSGNLVEQTHDLLNSNDTFEMIHEKIYKMLRAGKSEQKAEFALDVIFEISPDELLSLNYT